LKKKWKWCLKIDLHGIKEFVDEGVGPIHGDIFMEMLRVTMVTMGCTHFQYDDNDDDKYNDHG
jgi:hypothetical protein